MIYNTALKRLILALFASFRVLVGKQGVFSEIVFPSPWWERPTLQAISWIKSSVAKIICYFTGKPAFHVISCGLLAISMRFHLSLDRDTMVAATATLVGLTSVAVALTTILTSYLRGYVDWLWLALEDSGIGIALFLNATLLIVSASGPNKQSLAFAFVAWTQLFRTVYFSFQLFRPGSSMTERVQRFAREHFVRSSSNFARRLFPLGFPGVKVKNSIQLRVKLAELDMTYSGRIERISKVLTPSTDGRKLGVSIADYGQIGDNKVLNCVNNLLEGRFSIYEWKSNTVRQIQRYARWFSENATDAARQHQWNEFEDFIIGYAYLTGQACAFLEEVDEELRISKSILGVMIYTWNAPTEAFEYAVVFAPTVQSQKICTMAAELLYHMDTSAQTIHDYVDLIALPVIRTILFKRNSVDIDSVGESIGKALQHVLLHYLNQPTEIKFFFDQCDIIADIVKALRLLQSQFSDSELILRQRVGLKIVGDIIGVGGFTNNGEIARETRETIRSSVNSLFANTRWASMVGELPEQGGFLVLREEIQRDLRCILETVHAWN